ncbi:MAG: sporulation protein YunB [Eubacteriales bacterium]|nr:sporulation protein YunB [Eubacteriales bacterium]
MTACPGKKPALLRRLTLCALLLILLLMLLERNLTRVVLTLASAKAEVLAVQALNQAAEALIAEGVSYDSLVHVTLGEDGSVRLLQANTAGMNSLASRASLTAQARLEALQDQTVSVPLGSALGITLLAGTGPRIRVHMLPVGAVVTAYETEFTSAGINQTRHRVLLTMRAQVQLVLPTGASGVEAVTQVAVAESIIVGQVPDSFVNVGDDTDLLNLVP